MGVKLKLAPVTARVYLRSPGDSPLLARVVPLVSNLVQGLRGIQALCGVRKPKKLVRFALLFFSCILGSLLNLLRLPIAPDPMIGRNQGEGGDVKVRLEEERSVQELQEPRVSADNSYVEARCS